MKKKEKKATHKRSTFETFSEIVGWLQIFASPFLIGLFIGALIYIARPNILTLTIGIIVAITGLILGIIWATKIWKKKGTIDFISGTMATPELDNVNDKPE